MARVLAVDPGPHVGVAFFDDYAGWEEHEAWKEWEDTPAHFYESIETWTRDSALDAVICEGFNISGPRAKDANETIEMIGVLRFLCTRYSIPFVVQAPGDAKNFSTNAKLKRIGWYRPAPTDHARSASRHLLLYLTKSHLLPANRVLGLTAEEV